MNGEAAQRVEAMTNGGIRQIVGFALGILALAGALAAIIRPLNQSIDNQQRQIDALRGWTEDYGKGLVPSSATGAIGKLEEKFTEVETQFRDNKLRMDENEAQLSERSTLNRLHIEENQRIINELREMVARHDERLKMMK